MMSRCSLTFSLLCLLNLAFSADTTGLAQAQDAAPSQGIQSAVELDEQAPYQITAKLVAQDKNAFGHLIVQVELATDSYLYSLTQPGDLATKVEISLGGDGKIAGVLRPVTPPKVLENDPFLGGRSEKHYGTVHFVLPIEKISPRPFQEWQVAIRINGQVCSEQGTCQLIRNEIVKVGYAPLDQTSAGLLRQAEGKPSAKIR
jgi:thiol:disulfide interchange protein